MSRSLRRSSGIALAATIGLGLITALVPATMSTAAAKPPSRPSTVSGLTLTASLPSDAYEVSATWSPAANSTSYRVVMTTSAGAVLNQGSVAAAHYTGLVVKPAGTTVNVSVTAYNGRRHGKATTKSIVLPDLTAPDASYAVTPGNSANGDVTVQQTSLSDDLSSASALTQHIEGGDGPSTDVAGTVTAIPHGYGPTKAVYYPVVTVTDHAGNHSSYPLTAVVADV